MEAWQFRPCITEALGSGSGFRVQGSGFRVYGLGFGVSGLGFRVRRKEGGVPLPVAGLGLFNRRAYKRAFSSCLGPGATPYPPPPPPPNVSQAQANQLLASFELTSAFKPFNYAPAGSAA